MARYGMDFDRNSRHRDTGTDYDRDFGGYGGWNSAPRDWNRDWRSDYGHNEGHWGSGRGMTGRGRSGWSHENDVGRGGWYGMNHGWNGMDPGWNDTDRGRHDMGRNWNRMDQGWQGHGRHDRGWYNDDDHDWGDRLRSGWQRMRRGVRDMMGGYDRGW